MSIWHVYLQAKGCGGKSCPTARLAHMISPSLVWLTADASNLMSVK